MKILLTFFIIALLFGCDKDKADKKEMKFSEHICKKVFDNAYTSTKNYTMIWDKSSLKKASELANIYNTFCKD